MCLSDRSNRSSVMWFGKGGLCRDMAAHMQHCSRPNDRAHPHFHQYEVRGIRVVKHGQDKSCATLVRPSAPSFTHCELLFGTTETSVRLLWSGIEAVGTLTCVKARLPLP